MTDLIVKTFGTRIAKFSACERYRYTIIDIWDPSMPVLAFCMLNPSTATHLANDPTVERCETRARANGYGGLIIINIFAYRSTDPQALYGMSEQMAVGEHNDTHIVACARQASIVVCGWGNHGALFDRGAAVLKLLRDSGVRPYALKVNGSGQPAHPLYISYSASLRPL